MMMQSSLLAKGLNSSMPHWRLCPKTQKEWTKILAGSFLSSFLFISTNSRFFQDDELKFNADLFAMVRIWDHNKDVISHHMKIFLPGYGPANPKLANRLMSSRREVGRSLVDNCNWLLWVLYGMTTERRNRISPLYPGHNPFLNDFNEILAALFKRVANCYDSLKSRNCGHIRAVFQRVILSSL